MDTFFDEHPQAMFLFDTKTFDILKVNRAAEHIYGYPERIFVGIKTLALSPNVTINHWKQAKEFYTEHLHRDGTYFNVKVTLKPIKHEGKTVQWACIEALSECSEEYQQLQQLSSQVPAMLYHLTYCPDTDFFSMPYVSPGVEALLNHRAEDVATNPSLVFASIPDAYRQKLYMALRQSWMNNDNFSYRFPIQKNPEKIWVHTEARLECRSDGKAHWYGYLTDITQQAGDALKTVSSPPEQANAAKERFLAEMSHEIRTPLSSIVAVSALLADTPLNQQQKQYANIIQDSSTSLMHLIGDILDLSKIEAGKLELDSKTFNLKTFLKQVFSPIELRAMGKGLTTQLLIAPDIPLWLIGDSPRLQQVLVNLLNNALKFTAVGHIILEVEKKSVTQNLYTLIFRVRDTGIGISESQRKALFTPFEQGESSIQRKYGGTGLGLSISKELVGLMGGSIYCEYDDGETRFCFQLPLLSAVPSPQDLLPQTVAPLGTGLHSVDKTLLPFLLVEDNPLNQLVMSHTLDKLGFEYKVAENGIEALRLLEEKNFSLVLMDCQMPMLDGYGTTQRIRKEKGNKLPIIAITANALSTDREKCLKAGMNDYLSKPFTPEELMRVLKKWLP